MEYKRFVRWALLLPIVLPAVVGPLLFIPGMEATAAGEWIAILLWSLIFGGIPYLLFLVGFHLWMREKEDTRIRLALRLSPVVYALFLVACLLPFLLRRSGRDSVTGALVFGGIALALGYAYVAIAEAAWWFIGRRQIVPPAASPLPVD